MDSLLSHLDTTALADPPPEGSDPNWWSHVLPPSDARTALASWHPDGLLAVDRGRIVWRQDRAEWTAITQLSMLGRGVPGPRPRGCLLTLLWGEGHRVFLRGENDPLVKRTERSGLADLYGFEPAAFLDNVDDDGVVNLLMSHETTSARLRS